MLSAIEGALLHALTLPHLLEPHFHSVGLYIMC